MNKLGRRSLENIALIDPKLSIVIGMVSVDFTTIINNIKTKDGVYI
jgi:hypothetical protein